MTNTVGTCCKCGRVVNVTIDGLTGTKYVESHPGSGRGLCSGSGMPPRGHL